MDARTIATGIATTPLERYREAERALWFRYGLAPAERFVDIGRPPGRIRVLEVGLGDPVLFVHGLLGPDAWAPLVRELRGFRCLVLDRPGWGFSSPIDYSRTSYGSLVSDVLRGALDGLGVERAHVVGGSGGTLWTLRFAAADPSRVRSVTLIGAGPVHADTPIPSWLRLMASPLGALMVRRTSVKMLRSLLRSAGHGASLDDGRIADELIAWRLAASRETDAMPSERAMLRDALVSWPRGRWRENVLFNDAELRTIAHRTLYIHSEADAAGPIALARRIVALLPRAELHAVEGLSHEPWLEEPAGIAERIAEFLRAA